MGRRRSYPCRSSTTPISRVRETATSRFLDFAQKGKENGFEWGWVDTCCIDKTSSAELSEAINSMYRWYTEADSCYAYLSDVLTVAKVKKMRMFQPRICLRRVDGLLAAGHSKSFSRPQAWCSTYETGLCTGRRALYKG
jgi:hypothetical protein